MPLSVDTKRIYTDMANAGHALISKWVARQSDAGDAFLRYGSKGQMGEIWRKFIKIEKAVWHEEELTGEPVEQVIDEMIHHLLMLRWLLQKEGKDE